MAANVSQVDSAILGLTREFEVIAHNLANVGTAGYKRRCNAFARCLAGLSAEAGAESGRAIDLLTDFDFSQGSIVETGRSLDFALSGRGFFVIETPGGPLYTRNGTFHLDRNGHIADSAGRMVAGESGPITIPPDVGLSQISVSDDGQIRAGNTLIGRFELVDFGQDQKKLLAAGSSCFSAPQNLRSRPVENLIVKQGFKEASNVKPVEELVDMMTVSRLYEANMQLVSAGKDNSKSILNVAMS